MKATELPHQLGQSPWLENIGCELLNEGTLKALADDGALGSIMEADGGNRFQKRRAQAGRLTN